MLLHQFGCESDTSLWQRLVKRSRFVRNLFQRSRRRALYGEAGGRSTEVLETRVLLVAPQDFGDAPLPYPTTAAENGAQHTATGPSLGTNRDDETDGVHSAAADADDTTGSPDDEGGVTFGTMMVGALGATVTVNVQGAVGKLDAWIDFNGDGSWGGPGEQIFASQNVVVGNNNLTFDVPSYAIADPTFARFRLSTAGGLGPKGVATDGEVEDYQVTIANSSVSGGVFGGQNTISTAADSPYSVYAADVDGDGDMDVLSASRGNKIAWYENNGTPAVGSWTAHTISTAASGAISVFAADVDGDGDMDVLSASFIDDKIAWYENDGTPADGGWTARTISTPDTPWSVFAADVDGDGDLDVLSAAIIGDRIDWYENDGTPADGGWTARTISTATDGAAGVTAADVDGDGDMDVLSASAVGDKIAWHENDGTPADGGWTDHTISTTADATHNLFAADMDGDGDMDVVGAARSGNKVAWYENDGSEVFTERVLSTTDIGARSVFAADMDGDGDMDVLSASFQEDKVSWYENDGSQTFTRRTIEANADGAYSVFAADIDGDGDLDVLSASYRDDKIAWYENLDSDFGDAPSPYPTTEAENGARHKAIGPTLGATRDLEADGTHSTAADADGADEDGVTFGTMKVGALGSTVTVNVTGAAGKLDAWIDFNGDGAWGGPGEQIFASQNVVIGNNNLTFDVPSYAIAGTTYARFRLSTSGALGPEGAAVDGEVEDYQVTITNPAAASGVFDPQSVISTTAGFARSVFAADVDGDGDLDALSASSTDAKIAWYENNGSQNFTERTISTSAYGANSVFAADVDGDGDLDVLSASGSHNKIAWYENDGNQNFTSHTITTTASYARSVFVADVDGDGDIDVLSASTLDDKIAWYENDGNQNFTSHTISTAANAAHAVFAADVDGDGDMDVLSASKYDDKIAWYENDGNQNFTAHTISTAAGRPYGITAADVDGDGDLDVLSAAYSADGIDWYENDGNQNFTPHTISSAVNGAISVFAADVDGDGDLDVLSASYANDRIAWYENDGSQAFTPRTISTAADGAYSVFAADVDGDGDLDALSASRGDNKIAWYENDGPPSTISFTRQTPSSSPTNADTLVFRATFSETVVGVGIEDFAVNGTTTATVTGVSGGGSVYDITISGGNLANFNGTVGLNLSATPTIMDTSSNALPATEPTTDETYDVDNTAPSTTSFVRLTPATSPTNADTLIFRATFSESVINVGTADFAVSGITTATVTSVSGSGNMYDVTISGGNLDSFNGIVGLNFAMSPTITDDAGNSLPATEPTTDETYVVDNIAPTTTSFARQTPTNSPTNADTLIFRATFSEAVTGVGIEDFAVNGFTTATVTGVSGGGNQYDITISGGDLANFNGAVGLNFAASPSIADLATNPLVAGEPGTDETYVVDNIAPSTTSFVRLTPATSPTNADTLIFRATFSESVTGVGTGDFAVNGTTTATVTAVSGTGNQYDITISGGDLNNFNGNVGLNLNAAQNITDLAGNALPGGEPTTDEPYDLDNIGPAFTSPTTANVPENSTPVFAVAANDANGPTTFSIPSGVAGGPDGVKFAIDLNSGALRFLTAPDFEMPTDVGANNVYDVTVRATDGLGNSSTQNIAVTVTDVATNKIVYRILNATDVDVQVFENLVLATTTQFRNISDFANPLDTELAGFIAPEVVVEYPGTGDLGIIQQPSGGAANRAHFFNPSLPDLILPLPSGGAAAILNVQGGGGGDIFLATGMAPAFTGTVVFQGGLGNDFWIGLSLNVRQRLEGEEGDDLLFAGNGIDTLIGGAGNDFLFGGTGDTVIQTVAGTSSLTSSRSVVPTIPAAVFSAGLSVSQQLALINASRNMPAARLTGAGNDTIQGISNVVLIGTDGPDVINASSYRGAVTILGGGGNDTITGSGFNDSIDGGDGDDVLKGGNGNDLLVGGSGNDSLSGQAGHDQLLGGGGIDILSGGAGNDTLLGGDENDTLIGGLGNDLLDGGLGIDLGVGGQGKKLSPRKGTSVASSSDRITTDRIDELFATLFTWE